METKELIHEELKRLKTELEKLETAAREFQKLGEAGGQLAISVETLSDKYASHISSIEELIATRITEKTEALQSARSELDAKLEEIKTESLERFNEPIGKVSELSSQISSQVETVSSLIEKLDKVDFPIRLDKLDATTAGINQGVQNQISKLEKVESNVLDSLKNQSRQIEGLTESLNEIREELNGNHRELMGFQKVNRIISITVLVGSISVLTLLILQHFGLF